MEANRTLLLPKQHYSKYLYKSVHEPRIGGRHTTNPHISEGKLKICKNGQRVVFDDEGSYVECKNTGERLQVLEEDGEYVLDVWVNTEAAKEGTFGGQVHP